MSKSEKFALAALIVASNANDLAGDTIQFLVILLIAISFIFMERK
jgi:hypothetical protein